MTDNRPSPCSAGATRLTTCDGGTFTSRLSHRGRGRALLIEALSLTYAREERSFATQRLRALADFDPHVLTLALAQCQDLLGDVPDDPAFRGAFGLLTGAMQATEGAA